MLGELSGSEDKGGSRNSAKGRVGFFESSYLVLGKSVASSCTNSIASTPDFTIAVNNDMDSENQD